MTQTNKSIKAAPKPEIKAAPKPEAKVEEKVEPKKSPTLIELINAQAKITNNLSKGPSVQPLAQPVKLKTPERPGVPKAEKK